MRDTSRLVAFQRETYASLAVMGLVGLSRLGAVVMVGQDVLIDSVAIICSLALLLPQEEAIDLVQALRRIGPAKLIEATSTSIRA